MIFQAAPPTKPQEAKTTESAVHREFKDKQIHRLKVHISLDRDGDEQTIDYNFEATTDISKSANDGATLNFKISDYIFKAHDQVSQKKIIGTGKINIGNTGLPEAIMDNITNTHFWYPLLSLYLPASVTERGEFTVEDPLGTRVGLKGTGHVKGNSYDMEGTMDKGTENLGKYKLEWKIDRRGWVTKADGEITDLDGTVQFTVRGH